MTRKYSKHGNAKKDIKRAVKEELDNLKFKGIDITPEEIKKAYNRVYCRRYREKNKESVKEYQRNYRAKNIERLKEYYKAYKENGYKVLN